MRKTALALAIALTVVTVGQAAAPAISAPNCVRPSAPAHTLHAVLPNVSDAASKRGAMGTVWAVVRLDANGEPQDAAVRRSTNPRLNDAALHSALASTYAPAIRDCRPIASTYTYTFAVESF